MGDALRIHPILILLAFMGGGHLVGPVGVDLPVPALAVIRVLPGFARARLRVRPRTASAEVHSSDG